MGNYGSAEEYFADMDAQAMNDEAMAAQSAEGEAAAAEAAQQSEGGHMDKLKRYYGIPYSIAVGGDLELPPDVRRLCLSSDVEKLEARVKELEQANTILDSACVKALNERDQLKADLVEAQQIAILSNGQLSTDQEWKVMEYRHILNEKEG
jgi:hypothetical protein